jgi:glutamate carboxypeptidase
MNDTRTHLPKNEMRKILRLLKSREAEMVRTLESFVRCESPSHDKRAVDRFGEIVAAEWRKRDAKVRVLAVAKLGNQVRAEINLASGPGTRQQITILGHLDTVYPIGTLAKTPFRISGGRAWGPGTFDMKGGLVLALFAVDALKAAGIIPTKKLAFLWTSDEEIGSESSRRAIETEALRSDAVLVLEPSFGRDGRLKTARKGVGTAEIVVTGRSAHAGVDPEKGVNAVQELALQIERVMRLNNRGRGISVQTTVVSGGTVSNVIPDHARGKVDIRFSRAADGPRLDRKFRSLRPITRDARVEIRGGTNRPPLERTAAVRALFRHAQGLMRDMGLPLGEAATGGGSDGNLTAALGVPTLDGLGAVGDFPHSPREHIIIRALPERAALLAGLLATL